MKRRLIPCLPTQAQKCLTSLCKLLQLTAIRLIEAVRPITLTMLFGSTPACL